MASVAQGHHSWHIGLVQKGRCFVGLQCVFACVNALALATELFVPLIPEGEKQ